MRRAIAIGAFTAALVLAVTGCGGGTSVPVRGSTTARAHGSTLGGGHGILLVGNRGRKARIFLWRPGSPVKPLSLYGDYGWGANGSEGGFQGMSDGIWSPDGNSIAYVEDRWATLAPGVPYLYVMRSDGKHVRSLGESGYDDEGGTAPSWSPSGREIVYRREGDNEDGDLEQMFAIVDVSSRLERTLPADLSTGPPAWGTPGIAYFTDHGIMLMDPATGRSRLLTDRFFTAARDYQQGHQWHRLAWSPDGVLAVGDSTQIVLVADSGRVLGKLPIPPATYRVCDIAWSPDGKQILAATTSKTAALVGLWAGTVSTKRWESLPSVPTWKNYRYDCSISWR